MYVKGDIIVIDIIKVERVEDRVHILITPLTVPQRGINKASRRLKKLHSVTRDSSELPLDTPIAIINKVSFPMRKDQMVRSWSLVVPHDTNLSIVLGDHIHELGSI